MKVGFFLGETVALRHTWISHLALGVASQRLAPAYQRAVDNLRAGYNWRQTGRRHAQRLHHGFAPVEMVIAVTDQCPNACLKCYNRRPGGVASRQHHLDLDRLDIVLDDLASYRIRFVVVTGGEPFVDGRVLKFARRHPELTMLVYTSGGFTEADCVAMKELGTIIPALTVVDLKERVHDADRGAGSFQRMMETRQLLEYAQLPYGASLTVSRANYDAIVYDHLLDRLSRLFPFIRCMPYMPAGGGPDWLWAGLSEMRAVRFRIRQLAQRGYPVFDYVTAPVGYPCLAGGKRSFFIGPYGEHGVEVSPCVFMRTAVAVPLQFRWGCSDVRRVLNEAPCFVAARALTRRYQCIIQDRPRDWPTLFSQPNG